MIRDEMLCIADVIDELLGYEFVDHGPGDRGFKAAPTDMKSASRRQT